MSGRVFLFAGGGTGGHIYPGLAIAEALGRLAPAAGRGAVEAKFLCSDRGIDARILSQAGVAFFAVAAKPLGLRPRTLVRFLRGWGPTIRSARAEVRAARARGLEPAVVAMGGFVAAPCAQAARAERCPLWLVNLDAVPGKANRWIAGRVAPGKLLTSAPVGSAFARSWRVVPPIVRAGTALSAMTRAEARTGLGLNPQTPTLMVSGGSQGAASVNLLMAALARSRPGALSGWQVLHQSGEDDNTALENAYTVAGVKAVVTRFVSAMGVWWRAADLAVGRCGAGTVAEAWANGVPAVFLPYPFHRDQHQRANAAPLVSAGAAVVCDDLVSAEANLPVAGAVIADLLTDGARREGMRQSAERLGPADGAERVARALLGLDGVGV